MGGVQTAELGKMDMSQEGNQLQKLFFIYDAKHALLPQTRAPLLEHNQAAGINGPRVLGRFICFGGIVKILEMEEHGPSGKTDDTGVAEITFGKKTKLPKEA